MSPRTYQAIAMARAIEFYLKTGRKVNSAYTPGAMLRTAHRILGTEAPARASVQALQVVVPKLHQWAADQEAQS